MVTASLIRSKQIQRFQEIEYDILIIGGGITGAGIALDASVKGLKVALVEMNDFASGTSSKSTKLIHGGLRYLKNLEFGLVRETGTERAIAFKNAPHLVKAEPMMLPVLKNGSMSKLAVSFGVWFYDFLAGVPAKERRIMLSKVQAENTEPLLKKEILKGAAVYHEYRTDDARLTIEILKTARANGAEILNYCKAFEPIYQNQKVRGFKVFDSIDSNAFEIKAKVVINAAGPWVDEVRKSANAISNKKLVLSKGVHLVVDRAKLPVKQACYVDVLQNKGRMIFIIPRDKTTYIGTTDTFFENADAPNATQDDVNYLLDAVNAVFEGVHLKMEDIQSSWSGVRPLLYEEGKPSTELSRKDELFVAENDLITIAGGKLTGYRKMAERSVQKAIEIAGLNSNNKDTEHVVLSGGDIPCAINKFIGMKKDECSQIPHEAEYIERLVNRYGRETEEIISIAYQLYNEDRTLENPLELAELKYVVEKEWVMKPADFYVRRASMLYFYRPEIHSHREKNNLFFLKILGYSESQYKLFQQEFDIEYNSALKFD